MPSVRREPFGITRGHAAEGPRPVEAYHLDNGCGMAAIVLTYGAILAQCRVPDRYGRAENVILGLPTLGSYESPSLNPNIAGAVLGRYARCVSGGCFELNGHSYQLDIGEDGHHFHGGSLGFHRFVWEAEAEADAQGARVWLRLDRPDGDMGYPSAVTVGATYLLDVAGRLTITYRGTTGRSTILALTSHAFWNLAGHGTVDGHHLAVNASRVVTTDGQHIPRGPLAEVAGGGLDWRKAHPIGARKIDHCYWLDDSTWAATLYEPIGGRMMRVTTDQLGLAIYSGDGLPIGRAGFCLQTGALPDAPNRPDFPSVRLDPGVEYCHEVTYAFSVA